MGERPAQVGNSLLRPAFVIAVVVLASAAFGVNHAVRQWTKSMVKEAVPLRETLKKLRKDAFGPYRFVQSVEMEAAVEDSLDATDYITWQFEDTTIEEKRSPLKYAQLFVTYHTGGRDPVPHVPDQCYLGAGYSITQVDNEDVPIPSLNRTVPVRVVTFERSQVFAGEKPTVVYTFHSNGDFTATRNGVRNRITSLGVRHAYFSKIEVKFGSPTALPRTPNREETVAAAGKLLNYVLPELLKNHYPDWDAVLASEQVADAPGS